MSIRLETVANIAVILACTLFGVHYGTDLYKRARASPPPSPYQVGDIIQDTPELGLRQAGMTILLVTRSSCHFCSASMPFYRRMTEAARQSGVRVVGATSEELDANRSHLSSNKILAESVVSVEGNHIKASGTPTLILVRRNGQVVNSWVGQLQEAREGEVLNTIKGGT